MAITFGTPVVGYTGPPATSKDVTVTIASDDDYLVATISVDYNSNPSSVVLDPGGADECVFTEGVTQFAAGGGSARTEIWYFYDGLNGDSWPSAGDYTVRFTWDLSDEGAMGVLPLKGAAQQAPEATNVNAETASTTNNCTVTTVTDGALLVTAHGSYANTSDYAADDGQTVLYISNGNQSQMAGMAGYDIIASAAETTRGFSGTESNDWDSVGASFAPASGSPVASILQQH